MNTTGRAPVVRPEHRLLYDDARLVLDRHRLVVHVLHVDRCSYCGESWECTARTLALRAWRVAMTSAVSSPATEP
ncbi:MAG: hypothetical protein ACRDT1_12945 [Micromonosporaceae bacterium]